MTSGSVTSHAPSLTAPRAPPTPLQPETADARTGPDAIDPGLDRRERRLELHAEATEHHDARRKRRVRERELLSDQVLVAGEPIAEEVESPAQLLARLVDALRIALRVGLAKLREQHRRRRDERVVAVVLEHPHPGTALRVVRHESRQRILVFQVLVDDRRVVDDLVLVDQHRHLPVRVQAEEIRQLLLLLTQVDEDLLVLEILLGQYDADLLAEWT